MRGIDLRISFPRREDQLTIAVERFTARAGEAILLQGESGSGKSTALAMIGGVLPPGKTADLNVMTRGGTVSISDMWRTKAISGLRRMHARDIGFVLQTGGLLPYLSMRQNIEEALHLAELAGGARHPRPVEEIGELLGLDADVLAMRPADASVGQRQRVAVARAIVHGPSILLADEPSASLDFANADAVDQLILECTQTFGMVALVATHRPDRPHWRGVPRMTHRLERGSVGPLSVFTL